MLSESLTLGSAVDVARVLSFPIRPDMIVSALEQAVPSTPPKVLTAVLPLLLERHDFDVYTEAQVGQMVQLVAQTNHPPALLLVLGYLVPMHPHRRSAALHEALGQALWHTLDADREATTQVLLNWKVPQDSRYGHVLSLAARQGWTGGLDRLLAAQFASESIASKAQVEAARLGHLACVQRLDAFIQDPGYRCAALNRAAENGHRDVCAYLAPRVDRGHLFAMEQAALGGHLAVLDLLSQYLPDDADLEDILFAAVSTRPHRVATVNWTLRQGGARLDRTMSLKMALSQDETAPEIMAPVLQALLEGLDLQPLLETFSVPQLDRLGEVGSVEQRAVLLARYSATQLPRTQARTVAEQRHTLLSAHPSSRPSRPRPRS